MGERPARLTTASTAVPAFQVFRERVVAALPQLRESGHGDLKIVTGPEGGRLGVQIIVPVTVSVRELGTLQETGKELGIDVFTEIAAPPQRESPG
jgi:hypothetical protein